MTGKRALQLLAAAILLLALLGWNWRRVESFSQPEAGRAALAGADLPPSLAVTTMALGPLRGLISNALWWRTVRLQDEGNYFEAIQLADWITTLQPRLSSVWNYQAWNMAFNIASDATSPEEAWQWVRQGIVLLRDRGLVYNPGDRELNRQLAEIFYTKLCLNTDRNQRFYKHQWALRMGTYLEQGDRAELEALAAAPATLAALRADPAVAALLAAARARDLDLLAFTTWADAAAWPPAAAADLLAAPENREALRTIRHFVMRQALREIERLDAERMLAIDRQFGPLDWRLGQAYAIYYGAGHGADGNVDAAVVRQAMNNAFEQGRLVFLNQEHLILGNNLEIAGKLHDYLLARLEEAPNPGIQALYRSFHEFSAVVLFNYGYREEARNFYEEWLEMIPAPEHPRSFEAFLRDRANVVLGSARDDARGTVLASLFQAYFAWAIGDEHRAAGFERLARITWRQHQQKYLEQPERQLPPFGKLQRAALADAIARAPEGVRARLEAFAAAEADELPELTPDTPRRTVFLGEHHGEEADLPDWQPFGEN